MWPKERVVAALELREPDRIPWGEHHIDYNVFEDVLGRKTLVNAKFRETVAYWEGRRDEVVEHYKRDLPELVRALEMDIVPVREMPPKEYHPEPMKKLDNDMYEDSEGNLYKIASMTHELMPLHINTAYRRKATVESIQEEIDRLEEQYPLEPEDARWELIRHIVREMQGTHFVMVLCNGMEFPRFGQTEEESWMNLILQPEICEKIAELQGRQMIREARFFAGLGVDGIMAVGDLGHSSGMLASPTIFRRLCYPWQKAQAEEAHRLGLKVLRHCCGHVMPIIHDLAEINDAYESIQPTAGMDIRVLKEQVGERLCLWGGIWHEHLIAGTPQDIRQDAWYAFTHAAPGGGYIMGSSHSLAVGAKLENVLEMKKCRDEWGTYPIRLASTRNRSRC